MVFFDSDVVQVVEFDGNLWGGCTVLATYQCDKQEKDEALSECHEEKLNVSFAWVSFLNWKDFIIQTWTKNVFNLLSKPYSSYHLLLSFSYQRLVHLLNPPNSLILSLYLNAIGFLLKASTLWL